MGAGADEAQRLPGAIPPCGMRWPKGNIFPACAAFSSDFWTWSPARLGASSDAIQTPRKETYFRSTPHARAWGFLGRGATPRADGSRKGIDFRSVLLCVGDRSQSQAFRQKSDLRRRRKATERKHISGRPCMADRQPEPWGSPGLCSAPQGEDHSKGNIFPVGPMDSAPTDPRAAAA